MQEGRGTGGMVKGRQMVGPAACKLAAQPAACRRRHAPRLQGGEPRRCTRQAGGGRPEEAAGSARVRWAARTVNVRGRVARRGGPFIRA